MLSADAISVVLYQLKTSDFDTETDVEILNFAYNVMPASICGKATSNHKNKT